MSKMSKVEVVDSDQSTKTISLGSIKAFVADAYARNYEDFVEDLADELEVDVEELPELDVQVNVTIGSKTFSVPGFEAEEKEDNDEDN